MHKRFAVLMLALMSLASLPLFARGNPTVAFFDIDLGYRQDRLNWSLGDARKRGRHHGHGHHKGLKKISELSWKNIRSRQVMANLMVINCHNIYFRGTAAYGNIFDGKETDKDFGGTKCDHFLIEKSKARADKGEVFDLTAGVGYYFRFLCNRVQIAPLVGYSHHEQHFRMNDLRVVFDRNHEREGRVPGLDSSYRTRWFGPWAGVDLYLKMTRKWNLYASAEIHYAYYRARGNWNLRSDFVKDFKHNAIGWGQVYTWGLNYDLLCHWNVGIMGTYQSWCTTQGGKDRTFFRDGPRRTRLNKVRWHSVSVMGSIGFKY